MTTPVITGPFEDTSMPARAGYYPWSVVVFTGSGSEKHTFDTREEAEQFIEKEKPK